MGNGQIRLGCDIRSLQVQSRRDLGLVLNERGLLGEGAEVGVRFGYFSERLLDTWKGRRLYSIDPWYEFPGDVYRDIANVQQAQHDQIHWETVRRLEVFGSRSVIMRDTSIKAAAKFRDRQLDFVYLDAQHHYEAVREDIDLWYSKVKKNGLFGGHDYLDGELPEGLFEVKSAVDAFAKERGLEIVVTSADKKWPSWLMLAP